LNDELDDDAGKSPAPSRSNPGEPIKVTNGKLSQNLNGVAEAAYAVAVSRLLDEAQKAEVLTRGLASESAEMPQPTSPAKRHHLRGEENEQQKENGDGLF